MPAERDLARIRRLYQIPTAPASGRTLELTVDGDSVLRGWGRLGDLTVALLAGVAPLRPPVMPDCASAAAEPLVCVTDFTKALPFPDGSFDLVVLHRTLDQLAHLARQDQHPFVVGDFLSDVARILAAGGIVAGCIENRCGVNHVWRYAQNLLSRSRASGNADEGSHADIPGRFLRQARVDRQPALSVTSCYRALATSGYAGIKLFSVSPSLDSPYRLLSIERGWSRRTSRRHVEALRLQVAPASYIAWRVLAGLGVNQYLGDAIFFWGHKRC